MVIKGLKIILALIGLLSIVIDFFALFQGIMGIVIGISSIFSGGLLIAIVDLMYQSANHQKKIDMLINQVQALQHSQDYERAE